MVLLKEDMTFREKYECTCMTHYRAPVHPDIPKAVREGFGVGMLQGSLERDQ